MKQQTPFFITITSEVLRDKDLNPIEKLIFTEIMALTYSCGYCYASNSHFADIFDRAVETISRNISKLQSKGYIYSEVSQSDGNARKIFVKYTGQPFPRKCQDPLDENVNTSYQKCQDPLDENVKHSNTVSKSISKSLKKDTASGFSQNDFLESFIENHLSGMSESAKSGFYAFVVTQVKSLSEKLNRPLTQSECLTHCKKIIDGMQHQNENPVVNDSLIIQNPARDNLSRTEKPKKEIDFPQEFVEYYEAYTGLHPSKQKQTASTALTKWKIMRKTHTNAEILLQIQKYAEYLQKEDWRTKKGMQFVNEKFFFEGDWIEKKLIQEEKQQKSTNNNNYAKPNGKPTTRDFLRSYEKQCATFDPTSDIE